LQSVTS